MDENVEKELDKVNKELDEAKVKINDDSVSKEECQRKVRNLFWFIYFRSYCESC